MSRNNNIPRLSIVIATYNRGPILLRTLASLVRQDADPAEWEAVVVNNNSADVTQQLFSVFAGEHPGFCLRMVTETRQGLSHARNRGMAESRGPYIAIIDDDEEVNAGFARAYIDFFDSHPDVGAAGGKITPLYEYPVPLWLSKYTERPIAGTLDLGGKIAPFRGHAYPGGGNMAVRRSLVEKYGAFDPELGRTGAKLLAGEEKDLFGRLKAAGEKIYYVPGAEIFHIIPESKLTRSYFEPLTYMVGASEKVRTRNMSGWQYLKRIALEVVKWGGTIVIGTGYGLRGHGAKARYLFIMRRNITRGLLGMEQKKIGGR